MRFAAAFVIAASSLGATAAAQVPEPTAGETICFGRTYGAAHLAAHPAQTVTRMVVELTRYRDLPELQVAVLAELRDRPGQLLSGAGACGSSAGGALDCGIECDGGSFHLEATTADVLMLRNAGDGFRVHECGSEGAVFIAPGADDQLFRLVRLPADFCFDRE